MQTPLTVPQSQIDSKFAMIGPKDVVLGKLKDSENVLWLRANGSATLFFKVDGKRKQKTWARFIIDKTR